MKDPGPDHPMEIEKSADHLAFYADKGDILRTP